MNLETFFERLKEAVLKFPMVVDKFGDIRTEEEYELEKKCELHLCPIRVVHRHIKGENNINIHMDIAYLELEKEVGYAIIKAADNRKDCDENLRKQLEYYTMGEAS